MNSVCDHTRPWSGVRSITEEYMRQNYGRIIWRDRERGRRLVRLTLQTINSAVYTQPIVHAQPLYTHPIVFDLGSGMCVDAMQRVSAGLEKNTSLTQLNLTS